MTHEITLHGEIGDRLFMRCPCSLNPIAVLEQEPLPLDELNRLAHEHIEGADRRPIVR